MVRIDPRSMVSTYLRFCWVDRYFFVLAFLVGTGASALASHVLQIFTGITLQLANNTDANMLFLRDLVVFQVLTSVCTAFRGGLFSQLIHRIFHRVCKAAMAYVVHQPLAAFEMREGLSDILTHQLESYATQATLHANMLSRALTGMLVTLGFMAAQSPALTFMVLILCAARMAVFRRYEKAYALQCEQVQKKREAMFQLVREYLAHILTIRLFARDPWYVEHYQQMCDDMVRAKQAESRGYAIFLLVGQLLDKFVAVATLWAASTWKVPSAKIIYFLSYQTGVMEQLGTLIEAYRGALQSKDVYEKVSGVLQASQPQPLIPTPSLALHLEPPETWDVAFEDVRFAYPARPDKWVFRGFELVIPAGASCVVRGRSGSGKSTLLKLLVGFYVPQQGRVLLGGLPIAAYARERLFRHIAFVPQEPLLFHRSIRDNIAFGEADCDEADIDAACKAVGLQDFIRSLPQGYETLCSSEHGLSFMSGGQKQRLAIARALVRARHTRMVLMDEPVSALDDDSTSSIVAILLQRFWQNTGVTRIMISHNAAFLGRLPFDLAVDV